MLGAVVYLPFEAPTRSCPGAVADGTLSFTADGAGNTHVMVNDHSPANPWGITVTTLDHVSPWSIGSQDYIFHA